MQSWYEVEQLAKIRQREICLELCNRPQHSKKSMLTTFIQQVKQLLHQRYPEYLQEQLCCSDKI
ncbi:hypothetical protein SAMN05421852_102119 [Thermoflavimicrobium dichotomicum]|uniref:Uncharacterized protein n=1 Tax=Thermoflavimicrobium dichotomicum TaxID=46223 RepID=A0A1I3LC20_9BACL|nr:hypothetical protein SAMN05421852_102119 [Thermoflavimicrobium dichotomicum]